jgi:hypothetical protein
LCSPPDWDHERGIDTNAFEKIASEWFWVDSPLGVLAVIIIVVALYARTRSK